MSNEYFQSLLDTINTDQKVTSRVLICFYKLRDGYTSCTVFIQKKLTSDQVKDLLKMHIEQILLFIKQENQGKLNFSKRSVFVVLMELDKILFENENLLRTFEFHFKINILDKKIEKFVVSNKLKKYFSSFSKRKLPPIIDVTWLESLSDVEADEDCDFLEFKMRKRLKDEEEEDKRKKTNELSVKKKRENSLNKSLKDNKDNFFNRSHKDEKDLIETQMALNLNKTEYDVDQRSNAKHIHKFEELTKKISVYDNRFWDDPTENLLRGKYGHLTNDLEIMINLHILFNMNFISEGSFELKEDRVILKQPIGNSFGDFVKHRHKWYSSSDYRYGTIWCQSRINAKDINNFKILLFDFPVLDLTK